MSDKINSVLELAKEFNARVAKKYCLDISHKDAYISDEQARKFNFYTDIYSLTEKVALLKSSRFKSNEIPDDLTMKIAEANARIQNEAQGKIDIKDCIPNIALSREDYAELKKSLNLNALYLNR